MRFMLLDSSIRYYNEQNELAQMPCNNKAGFAVSSRKSATLPIHPSLQLEFPPRLCSWWGPIKIWHEMSDPTCTKSSISPTSSPNPTQSSDTFFLAPDALPQQLLPPGSDR